MPENGGCSRCGQRGHDVPSCGTTIVIPNPPEPRSSRRRRCALCGRLFHGPEGVAYQGAARVDLCHPVDSTAPMTCYHRWTVYKERP